MLIRVCLRPPWTIAHSVLGILQARILKWVAPFPGDLPNPGIELGSPALQEDSLRSEPPGKYMILMIIYAT